MADELNSFWNRKRETYNDFIRLHNELVPASGRAETIEGEALRNIGNIYYDFYNNGGINLSDDGIISDRHQERFGLASLREVLKEETYIHLICLAERASIESVFAEEGWSTHDGSITAWEKGTFLDDVVDEVIDWIKDRKPELFSFQSKVNRVDMTTVDVLDDAKASYPVVLRDVNTGDLSKAVIRVQSKTPAARKLAEKIATLVREDHEAYHHFLTVLNKD
jgi:hypothetical protein